MSYATIEAFVGNTPLVKLQRLPGETSNTILVKLEGNNPAGSVKDRPALNMIKQAEARGDIKKGDRLSVTYELTVAIELIKTKSDGIRSKVETSSEVASKPGEKPTRTISNTTTIIADIVDVDRAKKLVSVKGPSGKVTVVTVKNPQLLADVNVGEQVKVVYFDAMAASITTPKKK